MESPQLQQLHSFLYQPAAAKPKDAIANAASELAFVSDMSSPFRIDVSGNDIYGMYTNHSFCLGISEGVQRIKFVKRELHAPVQTIPIVELESRFKVLIAMARRRHREASLEHFLIDCGGPRRE